MLTAFFIFLGGMLARADGWGPANAGAWPEWKLKLARFFNAWTCSALFVLLTYAYSGQFLPSLSAGCAFLIWRAPGFDGWKKWLPMFWRGLWTSAIGFTGLSLTVHLYPYYGLLCIPMGVAEMLAYSGAYKWLLGRVPEWVVHVTAEISSGLVFTALVCIILGAI